MRLSFILVVAISELAFLAAGCGQTTSPTRPTAVVSRETSFASSSLVLSAASQHEVPFRGTLQGTDTDSDPTPSHIVVTTDGTGTATQLGRFSFSQRVTVCISGACTGTSDGTSHWVAANGDSLDTTIAGSGQPTPIPGEIRITEIHTITGGTGRFAGAHGRFTVDRTASAITFTTSGSFEGTITSPGPGN
jgi:hypothetical protein